MNFIDGVNYVSDVNNIPEKIVVIILCAFVICASAIMVKFMIAELACNYRNKNKDKNIILENILLFFLAIISVCNVITSILMGFNSTFCSSANKYKVNISEDVNMDEFLSTYEIIEYDDSDRTFTIKMRE